MHAVKKAKASHWNSILQNAKGKGIFKALSYTEQRTTRVIPELQYMQGGERRTAKEFQDQCIAFTTTLFSSPPSTNTSLQWSNYQQGAWEWQEELDEIEV
jgi:hypothetical protein